MATQKYEIVQSDPYKDPEGNWVNAAWHWQLRSGGDTVRSSPEAYETKAEAEKAAKKDAAAG